MGCPMAQWVKVSSKLVDGNDQSFPVEDLRKIGWAALKTLLGDHLKPVEGVADGNEETNL